MHAMHYAITLPADYDMGIIRKRVADKGHLLDHFGGLGFKAFLMRERGVDGSPVNQYAPFYLWHTVEGMNDFLWGPGFRTLSADFGRPVVQHWTGLRFTTGPAADATPRFASLSTEYVPAYADPATVIDRRPNTDEGVHSTLTAIDTRHWELITFTLWADEAPQDAGDRFQVLHLSRPGAGVSWP
jgi:hypothetical protein